MNILFVSDVYWPRINGVSTSIHSFRRALAAQGHRVLLVAPDYGPASHGDKSDSGTEAWVDETDLIRVPSRPVPADPEDRAMHWRWLRALARRLDNFAPDLVHVHTPFFAHYAGLRLARTLGLPCVASYHTHFEEYLHHYLPAVPRAWLAALARASARRQCNALHGVIVPSSAFAELLQQYGVQQPLAIIPTGVDVADLAGGDGRRFRARHGIPPEQPMLVHIGRAAHEKNIGFLLRMQARLLHTRPDALLVLAGAGPARRALEKQARKLGISARVKFLGYLPRGPELADCYQAANAFVFASRTETQGLVLLEAMALGVPVVSTAVLGARDVLQPESGALVVAEDEAAFAAEVLRLLDDPALAAALAQRGRRYALAWAPAAQATRLLQFYASVRSRAAAPATAAVATPAANSRH